MGAGRPKGGKKAGGRKKGTPNKVTKSVKEALVSAFVRVGGTSALVKWAKENPTEFYKIWSKLLPQEVKSEVSGPDGKPVEVKDVSPTPAGLVGQIDCLAAALLSAASREQGSTASEDGIPEPVRS